MNRCVIVLLFVFWPAAASADGDADRTARLAAQYEASGQFQLAADAYRETVRGLAARNGDFDLTLFEPLLGVGRSLSALGEDGTATDALLKAQNILRRNEGVHAIQQLEVIDELTHMAMRRSDAISADTQQRLSFLVSDRHHGKGSPESLQASYKLIAWYVDTGQYHLALTTVRRILDARLDGVSKSNPQLIEAHILAAKIRRLSGICCSEKSLEKVLDILDANPDLPMDTRARVYGELADAFIASRRPERAAEYYGLGQSAEHAPPRLIAMTRILADQPPVRTTVYRARENQITGTSSMVRMTWAEQVAAPDEAPQIFVVPNSENDYTTTIIETPASPGARRRTREVIGRPFQFLTDQLQVILPNSRRDTAKMSEMAVTLDFTVKRDGRVHNVEVTESNAPVRVNRLMREVLSKTRYRPALHNGVPTREDHVTVTQTFINTNHGT